MLRSLKLLGMFSILLAGCSSEKEYKKEIDTYKVINPVMMDTAFKNEYVADIHSIQNVEIRARVKGYIDAIYVDEGKHVKAGQTLFKLSDARYKEELVKATANLKNAIATSKAEELVLKNVKTLLSKNIVSQTEFDLEQAKVDAAKANVEIARANESSAKLTLSLTVIKAPFNGVINRIPYKTGSSIGEQTLLTSLSDNSEVYAYFNVSEREYLNFKSQKNIDSKNEVDLVLANNKLYPIKGTIETVEGEFDQSTGNIAFRAKFSNPNEVLKNGSSGKILVRKEIKNAMVIPQKCTFEIQDKTFVFTVDSTNTVHMKAIVPKYRFQFLYVIESGLNVGDRLISEGIQLVKEGDKVKTRSVTLKEVMAQESN